MNMESNAEATLGGHQCTRFLGLSTQGDLDSCVSSETSEDVGPDKLPLRLSWKLCLVVVVLLFAAGVWQFCAAARRDSVCDKTCNPLPQLPYPWDKINSTTFFKGYRLGDVFFFRKNIRISALHLERWPNSLASMYIRACGKDQEWTALSSCIRRKYAKEDWKQRSETRTHKATDFVIHLRLGDVLDDKARRKIPVEEYLQDWVTWWPGTGLFYVPPLAAYTKLKIPNNIRRVTIMGNPYFIVGLNCSHSLAYVAAIKRELHRMHPWLDVVVRFPPPPGSRLRGALGQDELADRDLHFVQSRAAVFVATKGGFSYLLGKIAMTAGHKVDWSIRELNVSKR